MFSGKIGVLSMYTYNRIKECYCQLMRMKADKQKENIDKKANVYKQELDRRAYEFKKRVQEDAMRQMAIIDNNTMNYKAQIDSEAEMHKKMIDETLRNKIESQTLTLDEVQGVISLLNRSVRR